MCICPHINISYCTDKISLNFRRSALSKNCCLWLFFLYLELKTTLIASVPGIYTPMVSHNILTQSSTSGVLLLAMRSSRTNNKRLNRTDIYRSTMLLVTWGKIPARYITPVKKSLLKLSQQLTTLILLQPTTYLRFMNKNLLFVTHKNLHECLLAIKIYNCY